MLTRASKQILLLYFLTNIHLPEAKQGTGHGEQGSSKDGDGWYTSMNGFQKLAGPTFDNNTVVNSTVQMGGTAYLQCRVRNLGERAVTWVRRRDWHILTTGLFTYTSDERFQVLHPDGTDDWTLLIKYVQMRDNGTYECQVATSNGILSHFVNLEIVVPEAFIVGGPEHHVVLGGDINLVCVIEKSPTPPQYVLWYHNNKMINYDTSREGVSVRTLQGQKTESHLAIKAAKFTDSGNYTCSASNTQPASITVFVSEGDKMAAISPRKSKSGCELTGGRAPNLTVLTLLLSVLSTWA